MLNYVLLFCCLTLLFSTGDSTNVKAVFASNPTNIKRFPRIILDGTLPNMNELTVCHWINAHVLKSKGNYIVSYAHGQASDEILTGVGPLIGNKTTLKLSISNQTFYTTTENFKLGKWNHLCFLWSSGGGLVTVYLNGKLAGNGKNILPRGKIRSGGVLIIGQDQDVYNGKFDLEESWEGYVSDVQIWDEALKPEQIDSIAKCGIKLNGNIFAWMQTPVIAMEGVLFSGTQLCGSQKEK